MTPTPQELKPCPFCGSKPFCQKNGVYLAPQYWECGCEECEFRLRAKTEEESIERWNTRHENGVAND